LKGWIVACHLKIASQPSKFTTKSKKIIWALSFLDGLLHSWSQPLINAYLLNLEGPSLQELISFDTLVHALWALFRDPNLERNAVAASNNLQQSTSLAQYCMHFVSHSQDMKMDGNALASYFY